MFVYDKTFDPKVVQSVYDHIFHIMSKYDLTFDTKVLKGHCDLISRFSDFALYPSTQLVYEHTSFTI